MNAEDERSETEHPESASPGLRGLWSTMGSGGVGDSSRSEPGMADHSDVESEAQDVTQRSITREDVLGPQSVDDVEPDQEERIASPGQQLALGSLFVGVVSVPLAALSTRAELSASLPATALGFLAVSMTLACLTASRRARPGRPQQVMATIGGLLGVAGMLLGPLYFNGLGNRMRAESERVETRQQLLSIGDALNTFHADNDRFPIGMQYSGTEPMHGWMADLLPYLEQDRLFAEIDFSVPYTDPLNAEPMGTLVPSFLAPGGSNDLVYRRFAPAHFAGVGGEVITEDNGLMHVGIFGRNRVVRREDLTDGLSQTLAAGQVRGLFSPWGAADNVRDVGDGLNRDGSSFGNPDGTGAMFLFADGSARFLSNEIDLETLRNLATSPVPE